jgi:hypothetical protein
VIKQSAFSNSNPNELYAIPKTLISHNKPFLWVSNFSSLPMTISKGQLIGHLQDPQAIYSSAASLTSKNRFQLSSYASLIQNFETLKSSNYSTSRPTVEIDEEREREQALLLNQPVEGGPKTAETPELITSASHLLKKVDILSNLTKDEFQRIGKVLQENYQAFALDGKLGSYEEEVNIPVVLDTRPISIPPFPMSPANREIIDKQMDSRLNLGVIEPSQSPWAAPVFIVHQNGKPRMVIDL